MSASSRRLAFLAYLLSFVGALYVLLTQRRDAFALYHARQSLALAIAAIGVPLALIACAWVLAWIPLFGPLLSLLVMVLLMTLLAMLAVSWIIGMVYALRGKVLPIPIIGGWARRLPWGAPARVELAAEPVERGT